MAISDTTRDKLRALKVSADALSQYCAGAVDNANDDSVQSDPLMGAVRRGYLAVSSIAGDFLSIDRPSSLARKTGTQVRAAITASMPAGAAQTTALNAFVPATSYSKTQVRSILGGLVPATVSGSQYNAILVALGFADPIVTP